MRIEIEKLKKIYDDEVVVDILSLYINQGEIVAIIGNNGAGKTSLMRLILDLIKSDGGYVKIDGQKVNESTEWKWYTGSFVSGRFLIDIYTPEEYFNFIASLYNITHEDLNERMQVFNKFMNGEILGKHKLISSFSEGNRQKIGIIGAMLVNPSVLLLDEPFNYLDPSSQVEMKKILRLYNQKYGTMILVSSHNIDCVMEISSRILLMEKGRIIKDLSNKGLETEKEIINFFSC